MQDYEQRVITEMSELNERRAKLDAFITSNPAFKTLKDFDQYLLVRQLDVMREYAGILARRIERFPKSNDIPQYADFRGTEAMSPANGQETLDCGCTVNKGYRCQFHGAP